MHAISGGSVANNTFDACKFQSCTDGMVIDCGASQNVITNTIFETVRYGIKIAAGSGNVSSANKFYPFGNREYSPIIFPLGQNGALGNVSSNDYMDMPPSSQKYLPLVTGDCEYTNAFVYTLNDSIKNTTTPVELYRLPLVSATSIIVSYTMTMTGHYRKGVLEIILDETGSNVVDIVDDFTWSGINSSDVSYHLSKIEFDATIEPNYVSVVYTSPEPEFDASIKYTYKIL